MILRYITGSEDLFLRDSHIGPDKVDNGRTHIGASFFTGDGIAPAVDQYFCTLLFGFRDISFNPFFGGLIDNLRQSSGRG